MRSDWLAPVLSVMHERQFDWLTHALPLEKLNIFQLLPQAMHETQRNPTEPKFSSAKDDVTPFKVNGDASTLPDQRIPTATCETSVYTPLLLILPTPLLSSLLLTLPTPLGVIFPITSLSSSSIPSSTVSISPSGGS